MQHFRAGGPQTSPQGPALPGVLLGKATTDWAELSVLCTRLLAVWGEDGQTQTGSLSDGVYVIGDQRLILSHPGLSSPPPWGGRETISLGQVKTDTFQTPLRQVWLHDHVGLRHSLIKRPAPELLQDAGVSGGKITCVCWGTQRTDPKPPIQDTVGCLVALPHVPVPDTRECSPAKGLCRCD